MATPNYAIPPWLKPPPDPGAEFTAAFHAGAQVAQEKARLAQSAQEAAMQAATRMEIAKQDNLQTQQRIEIEKSYQQQQIGIRKQQLDQAQQKIEAQAASAARRFAAQQQIKQKMASGMSPDEAYLSTPEAYSSMAGVAPLAKQMHERVNPFVPTANKDLGLVQVSPGHWIRGAPEGIGDAEPLLEKDTQKPIPGYYKAGNRVIKAPTPTDRSLKVQDDILKQKMTALNRTISLLNPDDPKELEQQQQLQSELSGLEKQRIGLAKGESPAGASPQEAAPMPKNKKDLVKGQKYQTPRGIATWNGEKFVKE